MTASKHSDFKIIRMLSVAAALFLLYCLGIACIPETLPRRGFGQKDNIVKVENVLFRARQPRVILVGSSLAALILDTMLPEDWGNLAIGAGSSLTGLEIIRRSELHPAAVVIEVNMLMRGTDEDLLENVYRKPLHSIRAAVPSLRLRNHPTTLLFSLIQRNKPGINTRNEEKYRVGMRYHTETFAQPFPKDILSSRLDEFTGFVRDLEAREIKVYLVRLPLDPKIAGLIQIQMVQKAVGESVPDGAFNWIDLPADNEFTTTDGIHLDTAGARRVAGILAAAVPE